MCFRNVQVHTALFQAVAGEDMEVEVWHHNLFLWDFRELSILHSSHVLTSVVKSFFVFNVWNPKKYAMVYIIGMCLPVGLTSVRWHWCITSHFQSYPLTLRLLSWYSHSCNTTVISKQNIAARVIPKPSSVLRPCRQPRRRLGTTDVGAINCSLHCINEYSDWL